MGADRATVAHASGAIAGARAAAAAPDLLAMRRATMEARMIGAAGAKAW
jgi:hypothetical protein